jgi:hypothetical protein
VELVFLGHAAWLAELGGLRILFDPLIEGAHHGGVFEVFPPRRVDARALAADFIVVSHRHPDHFDVESLALLAELDADSVVLTSDELVADTARALGFRTVRTLGTFDRVSLDSGRLLTMPSYGSEIEWGVVIEHAGAVVYHQVDSVLGGPERLRGTLASAAQALELPDRRLPIDLGIVRWQPLLEIEMQTGGPVAFPLSAYAELLDEVAVLDARAIVPGSAGSRHAAPFAAMNRIVYPVSESRFLRDVARRVPATRAFAAEIGARHRVERGAVERVGTASELVGVSEAEDDRVFRPIELPPLEEPRHDLAAEPARFERALGWVEAELRPALARAFSGMQSARPLVFVLELIGRAETRAISLVVDHDGAALHAGFDPEWDSLAAIALSELCAVIDFEKSWAEPLLSGLLRLSSRAYAVDEGGVRSLPVGRPFLYYALSYDESTRRSTERRVSACVGRAARRL